MSRPTLGQRLSQTKGRPSGFDYMRIVLAVSVIAVHSTVVVGIPNDVEWSTPLRPFFRAILPMFFTLSGFLVGGSLERCKTLVSFLGLRVIRIYPALTVEVLLSAFIIGLSLTTLTAGQYLSSPVFHSYLLNTIGDIHYSLPGVFDNNPTHQVNAQLWTVPFELGCYATLALLALLGLVRRPILAPLAAILICVIHVGLRLSKHLASHHGQLPTHVVADPAGGMPGILLVVSFLLGVSLYLYRERVRWDARLFAVCAIGAVVTLGLLNGGEYLGVFFASYLTVWLGLTDYRRVFIIRSADLSYGVYLYGFVIQQLFVALFPQYRIWWLNILVCVPSAMAFAALSWNLIEKPALKLRTPLMKLEAALFPASGRRFWQKDVPLEDAAAPREV